MAQVNTLKVYEVAGKRFDDYNEAQRYSSLCDKVDSIMEPITHGETSCDFSNGHGFIQQDPAAVSTARTAITGLAKELFPSCKADCMLPRWADDNDVYCLNRAFTQLDSITSDGREYGQPYYAAHPEKAKP
jgi:hypothetical protein